jgi:hypothetical protein
MAAVAAATVTAAATVGNVRREASRASLKRASRMPA